MKRPLKKNPRCNTDKTKSVHFPAGARPNPIWKGNYKVRYWESDWQSIIFGNDASYLKKILDAGFDGVYLDILDGYAHFE